MMNKIKTRTKTKKVIELEIRETDKNLFYELDTKNIPSFLNAMTGQDYTLYPFSAVEIILVHFRS